MHRVIVLVSLEEEVTGGSIKVELKYGIIPVYSETLNLCDTLKAAGKACPVEAGLQSASITEDIPSDIPGVSSAENY